MDINSHDVRVQGMDKIQSVFRFQGSNMIVHAKGPNMVKNMVIHPESRTNLMSSTMNMPQNFDENSNKESTRSLYYGRDTSPTAAEFKLKNFNQPFHLGYYQRSTSSRRKGSPVSMRSIDSSLTADIIQAVYNGKFTYCDRKQMYRALENSLFCKMSERRRKMKHKFETKRKISDNDSGEQESITSISSDDSTRIRYDTKQSTDRQSRNNNRDDMCGDYADFNTQNRYRRDAELDHVKNMASLQENTQIKSNDMLFSQTNTPSVPIQRNNLKVSVYSAKRLQNQTVMSQRDRFGNRYQLACQRFKTPLVLFSEKSCGNNNHNKHMACLDEDEDNKKKNDKDDSMSIFPNEAVRSRQQKNSNFSGEKRKFDTTSSICVIASKKRKIYNNNETMNGIKNNDFVFVKPVLPVKKSVPAKTREELISKSAGPFVDTVFNEQDKSNRSSSSLSVSPPCQEKEPELEMSDSTQLTTTTSFINRKLSTQTLDVTERKNNSCENVATDSPQSNIYSQSPLSRDVNKDDNIVNTPKQCKVTMDRTAADDKWDVTSIISTCNKASVSDTYTDDEIFNVANYVEKFKSREQPSKGNQDKRNENKKETVKPETTKAKNTAIKKCSVVVQNMQIIPKVPELVAEPSPVKNSLQDRIYAFWNVESDYECGTPIKHDENVMQGTPQIATPQSGIIKYNEEKCTPSTTNQTIHATTDNSKALIVKQTNEHVITETNTKLVKNAKGKSTQPHKVAKASPIMIRTRRQLKLAEKSTQNTKLVNNANIKSPQPDKSHKVAKASPARINKTRRQLETAEKSTPLKTTTLAKKNEKSSDKTTVKKPASYLTNTKRIRNKEQNNSLEAERTKKIEGKNKIVRQSKLTDTSGDADTLF